MATSDSELIGEALALTGYGDADVFTDSDVQEIVDIGKNEIRSFLGLPAADFYVRTSDTNSYRRDQALLWFTCLGLKLRAGEIGSANLTIGSIRSTSYSDNKAGAWKERMMMNLRSAGGGVSPGHVQVSRQNRNYEYDRPAGE
jgi:hypothetical protein